MCWRETKLCALLSLPYDGWPGAALRISNLTQNAEIVEAVACTFQHRGRGLLNGSKAAFFDNQKKSLLS